MQEKIFAYFLIIFVYLVEKVRDRENKAGIPDFMVVREGAMWYNL